MINTKIVFVSQVEKPDKPKVEVKVEVEVEVPKEEKEPEEPKEEVLFELPEEDKEFIYDNTHYTLRDIDNWHR